MEDLSDLQSRVDAARERMDGAEADQRKYGLRLDDLVRIVEGALSRQAADLQAARIRAASLETELDDARNAIARHEVDLAAKETDLARLAAQNDQLKSMVMTLLEVVEGRNVTPMRDAMLRLERGVRHLLTDSTSPLPRPQTAPQTAAPQTAAPARPVLVPNQTVQGRVPVRAVPAPTPKAPEDHDALIELSTADRGDAAAIVQEPPEVTPLRRASDPIER
jgi:hypothetical protein